MVDLIDVINLYIKLLNRQLHIHNIYKSVIIEEVNTSIPVLKQRFAKNFYKKCITLGNFNLYHKL